MTKKQLNEAHGKFRSVLDEYKQGLIEANDDLEEKQGEHESEARQEKIDKLQESIGYCENAEAALDDLIGDE